MLSQALQRECGLPPALRLKSVFGLSLPQEVQVYFVSRRQVLQTFPERPCTTSPLGLRIPHTLHSFVILHTRHTLCIWPLGWRSKSETLLCSPQVTQVRLACGRHFLHCHCAKCVLRYSGARGRGSSHPAPAHGGHKHAWHKYRVVSFSIYVTGNLERRRQSALLHSGY